MRLWDFEELLNLSESVHVAKWEICLPYTNGNSLPIAANSFSTEETDEKLTGIVLLFFVLRKIICSAHALHEVRVFILVSLFNITYENETDLRDESAVDAFISSSGTKLQ